MRARSPAQGTSRDSRAPGRHTSPRNRSATTRPHAYANSPYTSRSRAQLLGGRIAPYVGQSTLLDDFRANGYEVAWFSGQDETFGARESGLRYDSAYSDLGVRDAEITAHAEFRKRLYDYDVVPEAEPAALAVAW